MNIHDFLIEKGIFPNLIGFNMLVRAVEIVKEKKIFSITKDLYPQLAKEFDTSASKVERGIRHIVSNKLRISDYRSIGINKRPSNSELICFFADMKEDK